MVHHAPFVDEKHIDFLVIDSSNNTIRDFTHKSFSLVDRWRLPCFLLQTGIAIIYMERFKPGMI